MPPHTVSTGSLGAIVVLSALLCVAVPSESAAQRSIYWDALDVDATLDADGVLHVTESQTIVFNGGWNGGERIFNLRPRQRLTFESIVREDARTGERVPLDENSALYAIDQYAFTDRRTLRWRSRLATDPLFERQSLRYVLRYQLSRILNKDGDRYELDHDFVFPDREGMIRRFTLRLTLDPAWQPDTPVEEVYTAGPLEPGRSFVLTMPLRYLAAGTPIANDGRPAAEIQYAVAGILGFFVLSLVALYTRERALGRFEPASGGPVTADWIRQHIVSQPAEVVGAVWDDGVGSEEVVALIARMTSEGKLESRVREGTTEALVLTLKVDRTALDGYERDLVEGLFFNGRTSTSTDELQEHYRSTGFDPKKIVGPGLEARVKAFLPDGENPPVRRWPTVVLFLVGAGLLGKSLVDARGESPAPFLIGVVSLVVAGVLQIPGLQFRTYVDRDLRSMLLSLIPAALVAVGVSAFLWSWVGTDEVFLPLSTVGAVVALTLWALRAAVNGMKSRQHRAAIAVRKTLTAGRRYFERELQKAQPNLRDEWYPWLLAFGLGSDVETWTVRNATTTRPSAFGAGSSVSSGSSGSFSGSSSSGSVWTGGGGRSGGAGATASWAAAASVMAVGVSPPSASGSGGGSSGSSSGGSSGGGGGGGW